MQKSDCGLRERKRQATTTAIENAAVSAVEELGYDRTTVDAICNRADISQRTFFNYFPSKDAAIAGVPLTVDSTPGVTELLNDASVPVIVRLARIVDVAIKPELLTRELSHRRRALIKTYPQLHEFHMTGIDAYVNELATMLADRFTEFPHERSLPDISASAEAHLTVDTVGTALRFTIRSWVERGLDPESGSDALEQALHNMSLILQRNS